MTKRQKYKTLENKLLEATLILTLIGMIIVILNVLLTNKK